jgi:hypothetical protein
MSLSKKTLESIVKHIEYDSLPNELLINIIHDLEGQIVKQKENYECKLYDESCKMKKQNKEEYEQLKKQFEEDNQDEIKYLKSELEYNESKLKDKQREIEDLQNVNDELKNQLSEYIYGGDPPAGAVPDIGQADDHSVTSDEELEGMKMTNFTEFLQRCCIWSNIHITVKDQMNKKFYKIAPGSCDILYQAFKDWCVRNNIIKDRSKSKKNIPSKKEFYNLLVENHRQRYPDDWCQNGEQYPRSPNGSYITPRVNLKLDPDFINQ